MKYNQAQKSAHKNTTLIEELKSKNIFLNQLKHRKDDLSEKLRNLIEKNFDIDFNKL